VRAPRPVHSAIERNRATLQDEARLAELRRRVEALTPRERQVMQRVIAGLLNKQIAAELGASERTIKIHRANVMRKMGAESLPDLGPDGGKNRHIALKG
jgi:FixJ family two-component response regulator